MEELKLYHTVEDTGNPEVILKSVPFKSTAADCWVGEGYYFWEKYIKHAHRWGNIRYGHKKKKYVITSTTLYYSIVDCFNLFDHDHLDYLAYLKKLIENQEDVENATFENIVRYARNNDLFPFKIIRMAEQNKTKLEPSDESLIELRDGLSASFLSLTPRVVLFVKSLTDLEFDDFIIEYPDNYISGYVA
ncbi:hypothetical protein AAU57_08685 [Nonlabens sp. YIK11]|uniref:hypothetical protein n=1 Tax=Nonlabens sp. YIK11 TaxID=1453349 RepID=UPI0006DD23BB|nr:hypothetical protein [Nonlabens sp. YIK11]KQC33379.1 hypothetical protein AAU57_08685 [Nonlabens sp. YIK11]